MVLSDAPSAFSRKRRFPLSSTTQMVTSTLSFFASASAAATNALIVARSRRFLVGSSATETATMKVSITTKSLHMPRMLAADVPVFQCTCSADAGAPPWSRFLRQGGDFDLLRIVLKPRSLLRQNNQVLNVGNRVRCPRSPRRPGRGHRPHEQLSCLQADRVHVVRVIPENLIDRVPRQKPGELRDRIRSIEMEDLEPRCPPH